MSHRPAILGTVTNPVEYRAGSAPAWQADALCAQTDPALFHVDKGGDTRPARRICAACTVTEVCLEWSIAVHDDHGILGGTAPRERRKMRRLRGAA